MQSFREGNQPLERTEGDAVVVRAVPIWSALTTIPHNGAATVVPYCFE